MIRLIRFLITGDWHLHEWETVETRRLSWAGEGAMGSRIICRCKHCGIWKKFDLI